jgi:hypothetical protein
MKSSPLHAKNKFMVIGDGDFVKWLVYLGCISGDLIQGFGNMQMFST